MPVGAGSVPVGIRLIYKKMTTGKKTTAGIPAAGRMLVLLYTEENWR